MKKVEITEPFKVASRWSDAEQTVLINIVCVKCRNRYCNVDAKDHLIRCSECGLILKVEA